MEYEQTNFTKGEVVDVVARYLSLETETVSSAINLLEKLRVIPPYIFVELKVKRKEDALVGDPDE